MTRIAVVGSGITGFAAACELKRANCIVDVLEKEPIPGGMFRSGEFNRHIFDYGCFIFGAANTRLVLNKLFPHQFAKADAQSMTAWLNGKLIGYPISIRYVIENSTYLEKLSSAFALSILRLWQIIYKPDNMNTWLKYNLGSALSKYLYFDILLKKLYSSQLHQLSPLFAHYRLDEFKTKELFNLFANSVLPGKATSYYYTQYPKKGGVGKIAQTLWEYAADKGINLSLNSEVEDIQELKDHVLVKVKNHPDYIRYDGVIVTSYLPFMSPRDLPFRDLLVIIRVFRGSLPLENTICIYNLNNDSLWRRVTFFTGLRRSNSPPGEYCIGFEVTYPSGEEPPVEKAGKEIDIDYPALLGDKKAGKLIAEKHYIVSKAYPWYIRGCEQTVERYIQNTNSERIISCGRNAAFAYIASRHCLECGAKTARKLLYRLKIRNK